VHNVTMPEIKSLSHRHEAIMEWLIANPAEKLGTCATTFGVSQAWLSIIIHSDAFQMRYNELIEGHIDDRVMPLRDMLTGVAHKAVEKLGSAVEASMDPEFILTTADKTLHRLGFAPNRSVSPGDSGTNNTQINNYFSVSKEDLEAARGRRRELYEGKSAGSIEAQPATPALVHAEPSPEKV